MRYFGFAFIILCILIAPNFIWLATSTVRIENTSESTIQSIAYLVCEKIHAIGPLEPNESVFRFLEACGDDTLEIHVGTSRFCQIYVEGELYHVDATLDGLDTVSCQYDDLLSSLFITKVVP